MTRKANDFQVLKTVSDGVTAIDATSSYRFSAHTHDQFGIGLIIDGAQESWSGRGLVEAASGDIITVNPGEVHDGRPVQGRPRSWRMLYFEPAVVGAMFEAITDGARSGLELAHPVLANSGMEAPFRQLHLAVTGQPPAADLAKDEALLAIIAALSGLRVQSEDAHPSVARAVEQLRDDPARDVSLADLAATAGLNRFQILRAFRRAMGLTPRAFLIQQRLQLARRLIRTGCTPADAAAAAGFADQSHLTRLFRRTFGITPGRLAAAAR